MKIVCDYKIPSLNRLFAMNHWSRSKEKHKAQLALLYELKVLGSGCSTQTISLEDRSTLLTASDMLDSYLATARIKSPSKSRKKK